LCVRTGRIYRQCVLCENRALCTDCGVCLREQEGAVYWFCVCVCVCVCVCEREREREQGAVYCV